MGSYTTDTAGSLLGAIFMNLGSQNFNTRSYTPNRAVLIGTDPLFVWNDPSDPLVKYRPKLILTYGQKK